MSVAVIFTVVVVTVTVLVLALYLLKIALMLRRALSSLRAVNRSLKAIPAKTEPVAPILQSLNTDLGNARGLLEDLLARKRQAGPPPKAASSPTRAPGPGTVG